MALTIVVLGATGMVGEGVLHTALQDPDVGSVVVLGRRSCAVTHPKLREIVHSDLHDLSAIESSLSGLDACYFCLGVSSIGMSEADYRRTTYDLTMHVATTLSRLNPSMTFCYVSGEGTDGTEHGKRMWARVKGKTENDLTRLPFKAVFNFRPGFIRPIEGMQRTLSFAKPLLYLYPFFKAILPDHGCRLEDLGKAMLSVTRHGYERTVLENRDIERAAQHA